MFSHFEISEYTFKKVLDSYIKNEFISNELYSFVEMNKLYISGSLIHKYLSNSEYDINDIDIIVELDQYDENLFKNFFQLLGLEQSLDIVNNYYKFSKHINKCLYFNDADKLITINIIVVNMVVENFIEYEQPFNFLRNYYNEGHIYHYNEKGSQLTCNIYYRYSLDNIYHPIIKKYIDRNVSFHILGMQEYYKIDAIRFDDMERMINMYNLLNFTVIPLNSNDRYHEGKMAKPALWVDLDSSYKFTLKRNSRLDNIGIVCGENSGIICIDVDNRNNGVYHFENIVKKYGLPKGPFQITPNDGYHYIFKYNKEKMKNMKSKIRCLTFENQSVGIDLWIKNVQFVAEPSINRINNGKYKWIVLPTKDNIPELPDWFYDMYNSDSIDTEYNFNKPIINNNESFNWFTKYF